jgi:serine/threonine-protein kinase
MSGQLTPQQAQERSRVAALRAIALDDSLADAHAVLGVYLHAYDWDSNGAERELRRAIELDPNDATARFYYGIFLRSIGRLDEAVAQQATAIELDPLVPAFNETLAFTLLRAGRADEAFARVRTGLELDSTYWRAHAVLGSIFEFTHRYDEAIREYERANQLAGPSAHRTTGDLARVLALMGREHEARRLLSVLQARAARANIYEPAVATAFHALGDDDAAYDWLDHAFRQRQPELRFEAGDPRFGPMFADPRFLDLLRRLGLSR